MPRILSIDYGAKRTGLAVTDPFKMIASGLTGIHTKDLESYLSNYFRQEPVELVIIGHPLNFDNSDTHATPLVQAFINRFKKVFPTIPIVKVDERFTSKMAVQSMVQSGMKKKDRQNKNLVDEIAATIMLQEYLNNPSSL
ncbi:Holliday junction resolvase RuvX [Segetibacter sp. 3557_3]|uniref:Holliday junction resolvase RuvX n=1 Tax=Segetibacter sp. 3557_3 TaxID=2547429 RepID=UPI0010591F89|nr:Holliday junction resolvase RuvX [Segetibacter sp. 3557_3]TDH28795.1 Holliday junction resolvase RuvX [Segetibacter sp. 3557_3]